MPREPERLGRPVVSQRPPVPQVCGQSRTGLGSDRVSEREVIWENTERLGEPGWQFLLGYGIWDCVARESGVEGS